MQQRRPAGVRCPHCDSDTVQTGARHKTMPYRCRSQGCSKRFSAKIGTVMEASNLGFQVWMIATCQVTPSLKGVSSMTRNRDLNITQRRARFLAHRLRVALAAKGQVFKGPVACDETCVGGTCKTMSSALRKARKDTGRGRWAHLS